MPACVDCYKLDSQAQRCGVSGGSAIRKCSIAMLGKELGSLHGKRVLEIGCGFWIFSMVISGMVLTHIPRD